MRWTLVAISLACGPSSPESTEHSGGEDTEVVVETVTTDAGADTSSEGPRAPGECPARYGTSTPSCGQGDYPQGCRYAEGTCACGSDVHCGGAAPEPMPPRWICEPHPPVCAAAGTPCDEPGSSCATHPCGWSGVQCVDGTWQAYHHAGPP